jgi:hypothetical protein
MAVLTNTTTTSQFSSLTIQEIDFIERFTRNWTALREILGIMRPIRKQPGTKLVSSTATVNLADGNVAEGDIVPLSQVSVTPVTYADLTLKKYAKLVTAESVAKYGARIAVQKTDDALLNELQNEVLGDFYNFALTGTLTGNYNSFQMAVSMAIGLVVDKFKRMRRDYGQVVVFANTLDVYSYAGAAPVGLATQNGVQYLKNFLGASTMIVTSELPQGYVFAIPADNIILYYIDPADGDFKQLGLNYTTGSGETNLIGIHKEGAYERVSGRTDVLMGMKLWAEYIDAIAKVSIGDTPPSLASLTVSSGATGVTTVGDTKIAISGTAATLGTGESFVYKLDDTTAPTVLYYETLREGWTAIDNNEIITAATGTKITVAKINANRKAVASGNATVTAKAAG